MSGTIRRTVEPAHASGPEGRTLHAANDCGKTLYRATQECLTGPEKEMAPACHRGGSGGSYDLPRNVLRAYRGFRCSQDGDRIPIPSTIALTR